MGEDKKNKKKPLNAEVLSVGKPYSELKTRDIKDIKKEPFLGYKPKKDDKKKED